MSAIAGGDDSRSHSPDDARMAEEWPEVPWRGKADLDWLRATQQTLHVALELLANGGDAAPYPLQDSLQAIKEASRPFISPGELAGFESLVDRRLYQYASLALGETPPSADASPLPVGETYVSDIRLIEKVKHSPTSLEGLWAFGLLVLRDSPLADVSSASQAAFRRTLLLTSLEYPEDLRPLIERLIRRGDWDASESNNEFLHAAARKAIALDRTGLDDWLEKAHFGDMWPDFILHALTQQEFLARIRGELPEQGLGFWNWINEADRAKRALPIQDHSGNQQWFWDQLIQMLAGEMPSVAHHDTARLSGALATLQRVTPRDVSDVIGGLLAYWTVSYNIDAELSVTEFDGLLALRHLLGDRWPDESESLVVRHFSGPSGTSRFWRQIDRIPPDRRGSEYRDSWAERLPTELLVPWLERMRNMGGAGDGKDPRVASFERLRAFAKAPSGDEDLSYGIFRAKLPPTRRLELAEAYTEVVRDGFPDEIRRIMEVIESPPSPKKATARMWENYFAALPMDRSRISGESISSALDGLGGDEGVTAGLWTPWILGAFEPDTQQQEPSRSLEATLSGLHWLRRAVRALSQSRLPDEDRYFSTKECTRILERLPISGGTRLDTMSAWETWRLSGLLADSSMRLERLLTLIGFALASVEDLKRAVDYRYEGAPLDENAHADLVGVWKSAFNCSPSTELMDRWFDEGLSKQKRSVADEFEVLRRVARAEISMARLISHDLQGISALSQNRDLKEMAEILGTSLDEHVTELTKEDVDELASKIPVDQLRKLVKPLRRQLSRIVKAGRGADKLTKIVGAVANADDTGGEEQLRFDVESLLREVAAGIAVEVKHADDVMVEVTRGAFDLAVTQLMLNARVGARIVVTTDRDGGVVQLAFLDDGPGIAADLVDEDGNIRDGYANPDDKLFRGLRSARSAVGNIGGDLQILSQRESGKYFPVLLFRNLSKEQ